MFGIKKSFYTCKHLSLSANQFFNFFCPYPFKNLNEIISEHLKSGVKKQSNYSDRFKSDWVEPIAAAMIFLSILGLSLGPSVQADIITIGNPSNTSQSGGAGGISSDGSTVFGGIGSYRTGQFPAYKYAVGNGNMPTLLSHPNNTSAQAFDISGNGSIIVGDINDTATYWDNQGYHTLGYLPGATDSYAFGVSFDGSVIVGMSNSTGNSFRWTSATGLVNIGRFDAWEISGDGSTVIGNTYANNYNGIAGYWTDKTGFVAISDGSIDASPWAVSSDGKYIVGVYRGSGHGFYWSSDSGLKELSFEGLGISNDGKIAVGYNSSGAFLWNGYTNTTYNLFDYLKSINYTGISNWSNFTRANAIIGDNIHGYTIVGSGKVPQYPTYNGYVVRGLTFPVPEPSTYILTIISVVAIILFKIIA